MSQKQLAEKSEVSIRNIQMLDNDATISIRRKQIYYLDYLKRSVAI